MNDFNLETAEKPRLTALENSYANGSVEDELKRLFITLFREKLAEKTADVNVSGMAHLGSFDLVRRTVNADGLALLQGDGEEAATRFLYRAWLSRDCDGRGMAFLKTYLQLLYPNLCDVVQLWQKKDEPYPLGLISPLDDEVQDGITQISPEKHWLTSRIEIALDLSTTTNSITTLGGIFRAILPARLTPRYRFRLFFELVVKPVLFYDFLMEKFIESRAEWQKLVIANEGDSDLWHLGLDERPEESLRLEEGCVSGDLSAVKDVSITVFTGMRFLCPSGDPELWHLGDDDLPKEAPWLYASFLDAWMTSEKTFVTAEHRPSLTFEITSVRN